MCDLFRQTEEELAEKMNFHFDAAEADNCRAYLEHVRKLPADAREIYES
ncbi:MAG: aminoglycoside 6-adenylyltransferase [Eisenbergiella massiliensis]